MPLYLQMGSSAVGYRHLMGEEEFQSSNNNPLSSTNKSNNNNHQLLLNELIKPELRRTKSDSSSIIGSDLRPKRSVKGSSIINGGSVVYGGGSMVNGSEIGKKNYKVNSRGSSMVNYMFEKSNKKGKPSSIVIVVEDPGKKGPEKGTNCPKIVLKTPPGKSPGGLRFNGLDYGAPKKMGAPIIWTDSELGPSPSEVAAAVAKNMYLNRKEETESSFVGGWSLDESIEGLRSKLERWRTELPPVYGRGSEISSYESSRIPTTTKKTRRVRRNTDDGGLFSCFGNICGCEISITCGPGGAAAARKKGNLHRSPSSVDNSSFL